MLLLLLLLLLLVIVVGQLYRLLPKAVISRSLMRPRTSHRSDFYEAKYPITPSP